MLLSQVSSLIAANFSLFPDKTNLVFEILVQLVLVHSSRNLCLLQSRQLLELLIRVELVDVLGERLIRLSSPSLLINEFLREVAFFLLVLCLSVKTIDVFRIDLLVEHLFHSLWDTVAFLAWDLNLHRWTLVTWIAVRVDNPRRAVLTI